MRSHASIGSTRFISSDSVTPDLEPATLLDSLWLSSFYRERFRLEGYETRSQLASITNWSDVPTMTSDAVLEAGLTIVPANQRTAAIYCSGGTSARPKFIARSVDDIRRSADDAKAMFECGGVTADDTVMILQPFGVWAIGSIALNAFLSLGSRVIPVGAGIPDHVTHLLANEFHPSVIYASPRYARELGQTLRSAGVDPRSIGVRLFLLAGEGFGVSTRNVLSEEWGAETIDIYGSEETDGMGAECGEHRGLHLLDRSFLFEILRVEGEDDPSIGEIVVTTLGKQAFPLLRYRLGDVIQTVPEQCACGREGPLIRVVGRRDERLVLMGAAKIYGWQVVRALESFAGVFEAWQLHVTADERGTELLELLVCGGVDATGEDLLSARRTIELMSVDIAALVTSEVLAVRARFADRNQLTVTPRGKIPVLVDDRQYKQ